MPSSAQSLNDSTRLYCTPIWKIRKVVFKALAADTVIKKQEIEIRQLTGALKASDSSAIASRKAVDAAIQVGVHLENQLTVEQQKVTYWERISKKWKAGAIGGASLIILELVVILALAF